MIRAAGGSCFDDIIVPLYLTEATTPEMIAAGAKGGLLQACKYYPPHGTTNADFGRPLDHFIKNGVLEAMAEHGVILCVHGEEHGLRSEHYFDRHTNAEELFYRERMPRLIENYPKLKIVAEHLSTKAGVDFVRQAGENVTASITPQHLLYTAGHLLRGLKYHLYCLPLLKFTEDREALREAIADPHNTKFFAGTDSAPHTKKATPCGCAAGCFTGGIAPQLYAVAFEEAGVDLSTPQGQKTFTRFLCTNGPAFYDLAVSKETFTLVREEQAVTPLETPEGNVIPLALGVGPHCAEGTATLPWRIA
jgi:dihydroorotase